MSTPTDLNDSADSASVERLAQVFKCVICLDRLRNARMCPHCSKLACLSCMHTWLTQERPQCPHCRTPLHLHELVNCRWAEEVTQKIDSLQRSPLSPSSSRMGRTQTSGADQTSSTDICQQHQEKLCVYCVTCSACICHQCALWEGQHAGHSFLPLDQVWSEHFARVQEHLCDLKRRHAELEAMGHDVERNIEAVARAKEERVREIQEAKDRMLARLDTQKESKLRHLDSQKATIDEEIKRFMTVLSRVDSEMANMAKSKLIARADNYVRMLEELLNAPSAISPARIANWPVAADFSSEIVPAYDSCTFVLRSFSDCRLKADPVYSNELVVNGLCWRLKVYPDGNLVVRGQYLSVFLELTAGVPEPSKYEYRVEMIHQSSLSADGESVENLSGNSRNVSRSFASDFEVGECWGYNRFFRLELLANEGYLDLERDILILRFHVRPPSFYQKSRDQQWYIDQLETAQSRFQHELASLKQVLEFEERRNSRQDVGDAADELATSAVALIDNTGSRPLPKKDCRTAARLVRECSNTIEPIPTAVAVETGSDKDDDDEDGANNNNNNNNNINTGDDDDDEDDDDDDDEALTISIAATGTDNVDDAVTEVDDEHNVGDKRSLGTSLANNRFERTIAATWGNCDENDVDNKTMSLDFDVTGESTLDNSQLAVAREQSIPPALPIVGQLVGASNVDSFMGEGSAELVRSRASSFPGGLDRMAAESENNRQADGGSTERFSDGGYTVERMFIVNLDSSTPAIRPSSSANQQGVPLVLSVPPSIPALFDGNPVLRRSSSGGRRGRRVVAHPNGDSRGGGRLFAQTSDCRGSSDV